jgi:D-beta-D-heptose 7-phosphate kinase / D-beta-D-heptose 1-phosphate adenosyltransferase
MHPESWVRLLGSMHSARVLVLGDAMLDCFAYGAVERISPEAPIPVVKVHRHANMPGGAANVARNIADLGAKAILVGVVGADAEGEELRQQLALSPTIRAHLISDASRPTTLKTRYVADGQQVMRADREITEPVSEEVAGRLIEAYRQALEEADLVVLSDYAKGVLSDAVARVAIDAARRVGKTVIVDPKSRDFEKYRGAAIITPNRQELKLACGEECATDDQVVAGARRILAQGVCDYLLVTRGSDGMSVIGGQSTAVHLPTAARQVFDLSGAGDTVIAALSLGLAAGGDLITAATLANIAAGIAVGKPGTASATPGEIVSAIAPTDGRSDPLKIFGLESVQQLVRRWREQGLKIAFTNGCFDCLHPGHIALLEQARRCADRLVVGLNADISVSRLKGRNRPVQGEVARAAVLAAIKSVDAVVIFAQATPLELIEALKPDVLVKGGDYTIDTVVGADLVLKQGGKVILAELLPGHSTTETLRRASGDAPD